MKILFIQPTSDKRGHYGIYSVNVCQELARQGNDVTLFTNKVAPEKYLDEKPLFQIVEWKNGRYAFQSSDEKKLKLPFYYIYSYLRNSFVIVKAALRYAKKNGFDMIQVTDAEYGTLSLLLKFIGRKGPPVVLLIHAPNFSFSKYSGNFLLKSYKQFQRSIFLHRFGREIRAVVSLGEQHKQELQKQLELKPSFPVRVIHDGSARPKVSLSKQEARKQLNISHSGPLFLFFGMLRKDKGIENLLEAFSLVKNPDARLVVAGSLFDYKESQIQELVDKFGIRDKVFLRLGYVEDHQVPAYFFSADAVVFPYRNIYTGGSGPLLKEAAVFRTPVIVTDVSEMGRLAREKQIGLVAQPENPRALAQQMDAFLRLPKEEVARFVENADRVANTWKSMAEKYLALYQEILPGKA